MDYTVEFMFAHSTEHVEHARGKQSRSSAGTGKDVEMEPVASAEDEDGDDDAKPLLGSNLQICKDLWYQCTRS